MKTCFKCSVSKPVSEFYKHPQMADGLLGKCKDCTRKDVRENRENNIEYYRGYDRDRGNRQNPEYIRNYRAKYPNIYKAHNAVNNAVRDGILKPSTCESCDSSDKAHAHHDDYLKPLDVRWLCPACHSLWHKKNGEGLNSR